MEEFYCIPVAHWTFVHEGFSNDAQLAFDPADNIVVLMKDQKKTFVYNQQGHLLAHAENVSDTLPDGPPMAELIKGLKFRHTPIAAAISEKGVLAVFCGDEVILHKQKCVAPAPGAE